MTDQKNFRHAAPALVAVVIAVVLAGCFGEGIQTTVDPRTESTRVIHNLYALVTWIDIGIFIAVFGPLVYALFRFREKKGQELPKQVHGHVGLEIAWTVIPAVLLLFIAVPTWIGIFRAYNPPQGDTLKIEAIGHQWWWEFNYPSLGVVTGNEMHVPVGKPIVIDTFSKDVIHAIWMPKLAAKIDTLPGHTNTIWFEAEETGLYYGQCAEFCGTSHANMRFRVIVDTEEDFRAWVAKQSQPPVPESEDARAGHDLFAQKACVACHAIKGVAGAAGVIGPSLNNLKQRTSLASGIIDNTPENLAKWIQDPQAIKPGALMVLPIPVNAEEARQLAAFLLSSPGTEAMASQAMMAPRPEAAAPAAAPEQAPTAAAMTPAAGPSTERGKEVYLTVCIACHGPDPTKDGPLGPAISGASKELVEARVMNGNANFDKSYPPGYTPKRPTKIMTPFPQVQPDIDSIVLYLESAK